MDYIIHTEHLSKSFGQVRAINHVGLGIEQGELFGLIGPDGAGKTTLFRILVTLLRPDEGVARVHGYDSIRDYRKIRNLIGYMPGRFSLYQDLSVQENLEFYATVFGTTIHENYDMIKEVYRHIEPFRNRLAGRLSGGMKQKLALSCALIHRPSILILDEPTTGVDAVSRKEFWEMLKHIQKEGITIVVSTPYMDEAARCDRIALMQKGSILSINRPDKMPHSGRYPMYCLKSENDLYALLLKVRKQVPCKTAYLFGNEIHVTLNKEEESAHAGSVVHSWKDPTLSWESMQPGIEDYFMELMVESEDG